MKLKLWQFEWDFDKDDAKIAVPILLLALGLAFTRLTKTWLLVGAVVYYLLYFFLKPGYEGLRRWLVIVRLWKSRKCPSCKSRNVFLQGYDGYHSDEQYAYHACNDCGRTCILVNFRMIKSEIGSANQP